MKRLSATDPVAVVALLKELGVDERLGTLIEGESLMNDGSAIVVFTVALRALTHESCCDAVDMIAWTFRLSLGGPILGYIVGTSFVL
jgi:NhaP-type Na+/H+ or K+/H+ antiporter